LILVVLILSTILTLAGSFWDQQTMMVTGTCQLGEAVPPIQAVAALILLLAWNALARRFRPSWALTPLEVLFTYGVVTFAVSLSSHGGAMYFFGYLTPLFYFPTPENRLARLQPHIPTWFVPRREALMVDFYEGQADRVPWGEWLGPLFWWSLFFLAFFITTQCLALLFRRQWMERERLTFPLVQFVTHLTETAGRRFAGPPFWRDPLMWLGFGIAFVFNATNILHAFNPAVLALGYGFDLGSLFTERPFSAIRPLYFRYDLLLFGLGYLMPMEILFSVWASLLLFKAEAIGAVMLGYEVAGMPFEQEQGVGAYVALALFFLWLARKPLGNALRKGKEGREGERGDRAAVCGALGGLAFVLGFSIHAGMLKWTALLFFGLILAFALGYTRIRAETGAPMIWLFPFYQQIKALEYTFGTGPLAPGGNLRNLTILNTFGFLARGYSPAFMSYQMDNLKLAEESGKMRTMAWLGLFAIVMGLPIAFYTHLLAYYHYGDNVLYTVKMPTEFLDVVRWGDAPAPPDGTRIAFTGVGLVVTSALVILRMVFLRFPLHPLGFAMVCSYGHPLWGPFLVVWWIKRTVQKLGGMRLYRRLIPLFLGLTLGHFFTAGVVWGGLGATGLEMFRHYIVFFG
jgi:hypothetical protein